MSRIGVILGLGMMAAAGLAAGLPPTSHAQETGERAEDYPDLPGREETFAYCTGCHGFKVVAAQGMTRQQWDGTLTWMTERQGMGDIEGETRDLVLDYLEKAFPPRRQPGGWQNPFAN